MLAVGPGAGGSSCFGDRGGGAVSDGNCITGSGAGRSCVSDLVGPFEFGPGKGGRLLTVL